MASARQVKGLIQAACAASAACLWVTPQVSAAQPAPTAAIDPGQLAGVWTRNGTKSTIKYTARERVITAADGAKPPLRPEAAALLEKRLTDSDHGAPYADSVSQCLPGGIPKTEFFGATPMQIIPERDQVTILFEEMNHFRVIRLNKPHLPDPDPSYNGNSVGHWEGTTLVVDTIAQNDKTTLDAAGTPHSDSLHVVERFRRTGPDTLELLATIDDPKTFTAPWTARATFKDQPGLTLQEYICDNNRNVSDPTSTLQGFSPVPLGK